MTTARLGFQFLRFAVLAIATVALLFVGTIFATLPGERHARALPPSALEDAGHTES